MVKGCLRDITEPTCSGARERRGKREGMREERRELDMDIKVERR
jgi:hypothetical protein